MKQTIGFQPIYFIRILMCFALMPSLFVGQVVWAATLTVNQDGSGDYSTIQEAIDNASSGDVIEIAAGTYQEDVHIGNLNLPPVNKPNLTLRAAEGAEVIIELPNQTNRLQSLAEAGLDLGARDRMGVLINGDGTVLEGLTIVQTETEVNGLGVVIGMTISSSNVTIRDCEFSGPGGDVEGDVVGVATTPLDVVSLQSGNGGLVDNVNFENCSFHDFPFSFANANLPRELGLQVPSGTVTATNCEMFNAQNGVEVDGGITRLVNCRIHDNVNGMRLSDETTFVENCLIENNSNHGIWIDDQELEDDAPSEWPEVTIANSRIRSNGTDEHHGIFHETGTLSVGNTVIYNNSFANVAFNTEDDRATTASINQSDLYQALVQIGIWVQAFETGSVSVEVTNSNIVDFDGVLNDAGDAPEITLRSVNIFTDGNQIVGPVDVQENLLNVDPMYVDPPNSDFRLQPGSPVVDAGIDGTFLGALGVEGETKVTSWSLH